jgi:hypothetical protein
MANTAQRYLKDITRTAEHAEVPCFASSMEDRALLTLPDTRGRIPRKFLQPPFGPFQSQSHQGGLQCPSWSGNCPLGSFKFQKR